MSMDREFALELNSHTEPPCGEGCGHDHHDGYDQRQPVKAAIKPGRNDPCFCGSGKKYKKCCLNSSAE